MLFPEQQLVFCPGWIFNPIGTRINARLAPSAQDLPGFNQLGLPVFSKQARSGNNQLKTFLKLGIDFSNLCKLV